MHKSKRVFLYVMILSLLMIGCQKNASHPSSEEGESITTGATVNAGENETGSESDKTNESESTSESQTTSETEKPSESQKPSETEKPGESQKPSETEKPSESQKPSETEKPSESQKPSETKKPSESQKPGGSEETTESGNPTEKPVDNPDFEDPIEIEPVVGLKEDFLFGCDMSTLIAQENSGVVYYNEQGEKQDPLLTLANNGVNMVRVRVWNDPYDENGNGYGGGNCDTANAIAIGKRATSYGMQCFIDYHFSDFWCDPSKQMSPKAWVGMTMIEKEKAIYDYTKDSLGQILKAGVDVTMVQIGNEITSGMSGETNWDNITTLLKSAGKAVRELSKQYGKDIQIAVHFTNPEKSGSYAYYAKTLADYGVDYDVFASSYYFFWHGTLDNLTTVLGDIAKTYGKKVMVAEISYAYTYADGDGHANTIHEGAWGTFGYEVSTQGQADCVRDCVAALAKLGDAAIGVCYWEPAWIPVPNNTGLTRLTLWERYGSGWASSFASEYDPKDAGVYYGGSAWDNQALFDFEGHPLPSIEMFEKMK